MADWKGQAGALVHLVAYPYSYVQGKEGDAEYEQEIRIVGTEGPS